MRTRRRASSHGFSTRTGSRGCTRPHTFVLERGPDGQVVEAFTPDFFLPGANLYVELTTQRPGLGARKRRKVRKAQERHGIFVVLHERAHFERLRRLYLYSRR